MAWDKSDYFMTGYAMAGSISSFVPEEAQIPDIETKTIMEMKSIATVTMPPRFHEDAATFLDYYREYRNRDYPQLKYSNEDRDNYGVAADRESYICAALWKIGLYKYINGNENIEDGQALTLSQLLSYALDNNLVVALNPNDIESLAGTVVRSGDIILCQTNTGIESGQLFGIADCYVYDETKHCGLKFIRNVNQFQYSSIQETSTIQNPIVVFRPMLELYGLPALGRDNFEAFISNKLNAKSNTSQVQLMPLENISIDQTVGASGDGGTIDVATARKYVWQELLKELQNEYGVAGLMGNLSAESGFKSNNLQNSYNTSLNMTDAEYTAKVDNGTYTNFVNDSAGYGLAQWTYYSRKQKLINFAKSTGCSIGSLAMQVNFLINELKTSYSSIWEQLKEAETVRTASNVVLLQFERPQDQSEAAQIKRANMGQTIYDELHRTTVSQSVSFDANQQPEGSVMLVSGSESAYEQTGLFRDANNNVYTVDTTGWTFFSWASDWTITSKFGWRGQPATAAAQQSGTVGNQTWHNGTDMVPRNGGSSNIYSICSGTITTISTDTSQARGVYVKYTPDTMPSMGIIVQHLQSGSIPTGLAVGQHISAGTLLGVMGNTGASAGAHLHIEFQVPSYTADGKTRNAINPFAYLVSKLNCKITAAN